MIAGASAATSWTVEGVKVATAGIAGASDSSPASGEVHAITAIESAAITTKMWKYLFKEVNLFSFLGVLDVPTQILGLKTS